MLHIAHFRRGSLFEQDPMSIYKNASLLFHCWSLPVPCRYSRDSPVIASLEADHAGTFKLTITMTSFFASSAVSYLLRRSPCRMWRRGWSDVSLVAQISCW